MEIRKATEADLADIMRIFVTAKQFMTAHGNPNQWGVTGQWPPEDQIRKDLANNCCHVCMEQGRVVGTFYMNYGTHIDPTYDVIYDGAWVGEETYSVVHRIASDGSVPGVGTFCLNWAYEHHHHVRIDTHHDNVVMQNLLKKLGFVQCGIIHLENGDERLAFEKI